MHTRGPRSKTRSSFSCTPITRATRISRQLRKYNAGDKIVLMIDSGVHTGLYHRRYIGKVGEITLVKGPRSYVIRTGCKEIHTVNAHFKLL